MKILILGAGPTGLGAAWKFQRLGHADWELWEAEPGGHADAGRRAPRTGPCPHKDTPMIGQLA